MPQLAISPQERRRRKSRNRKILIGFFVFIGVVVILESPLARVRHIQVSGNRTIPETRIISESGVHLGDSLWQVNASHVSRSVTGSEPMVQSVRVTTNWLQGTIHVDVLERQIVALYETSGKFYNLLNDGVVYQSSGVMNGLPFPVITGETASVKNGQPINPDVTSICGQLQKISAQIENSVSEFHVNGDGTVSMYLDNGFVVLADAKGLVGAMNAMNTAVNYFIQKGYKPGTIDLSGLPPYQYTPFSSAQQGNAAKGGQ